MSSKEKKRSDPPSMEAPAQRSPLNLEALMGDFYAEADEHLQSLKAILVELVEPIQRQRPVGSKALEKMFRHFHTLKGLCAMVGYKEAEEAAHFVESYLRGFKGQELFLTTRDLEAIKGLVSYIEEVVEAKRLGHSVPGTDTVKAIMEDLEAKAKDEPSRERPVPSAHEIRGSQQEDIKAPSGIGPEEEAQIKEAVLSGEKILKILFSPSKERAEKGMNVNNLRDVLQKRGRLIRAEPKVGSQGKVEFLFLVATKEPEELLSELEPYAIKHEPYSFEPKSATQPKPHQGPDRPVSVSAGPPGVVRVDIGRIEAIMAMVGDLVITKARLGELTDSFQKQLGVKAVRPLIEVTQKMERQLKVLREGVMRLRMIPIGDIFSRMQFVVMDLIKGSNKEVDLIAKGNETEIDKFVVERMVDPLLHLVRNSISHGIEPPEERVQAGKPPKGTILLEAFTSGDQVVISVEDDGRGLDREEIAKKAREQGLLLPGEVLTDERLLSIISSQGFSTRREADRGSGRGVGMAVVRETVKELGGELRVESEPRRGTRFTIVLPLTLAITDALILQASGHTYAIPQGIVTEVIEIDPDMVTISQGIELILYRGSVIPIVRLNRVFGLPEKDAKKLFGLIIATGKNLKALVIDRIMGRREVVVRPITDPLIQIPGISGATELGDGRAVLILDSRIVTQPLRHM